MSEKEETRFSEWFNEIESYGMRCERFYDDVTIPDEVRRVIMVTKWLREAYSQGAKSNEHILPGKRS